MRRRSDTSGRLQVEASQSLDLTDDCDGQVLFKTRSGQIVRARYGPTVKEGDEYASSKELYENLQKLVPSAECDSHLKLVLPLASSE